MLTLLFSTDNIAAVGYCFGGMVVLDLARMGAPPGLRAVASLHGILVPTHTGAGRDLSLEQTAIAPRVLVLHASKDPFVPPEQVRPRDRVVAGPPAVVVKIQRSLNGEPHKLLAWICIYIYESSQRNNGGNLMVCALK